MDIIKSFRQLPIGKYQDIRAIAESDKDGLDMQVDILAILADTDADTILNLPLPEFKEMCAASRFLEGVCTDVSSTIAKEYRIGSWVLIPVRDMRKVTTAQYVDFQEYAKGGESSLVEVLSCLLIPKGKKYNQDYDIVEVQKAIRESLSVADVLSIAAFFLTSYKESIKDSLNYSRQEAMRIPEEERRLMMLQRIEEAQRLLLNDGDGLPM